ncbi:MAG: PAS domain S-box protein [Flavipsychrobacter sp.]
MAGKILLIHDDTAYVKTVRNLLLKLGYETKDLLTFDAIETAINTPVPNPSVILTHLPHNNGESFNRLHNCYANTPIIILCTSDQLNIALQLIAEGAEDYFIKEDTEIKALDKALKRSIARKIRATGSKDSKGLVDIIKKQKEQLDDILGSITDVVWQRRADDFSLIYINNACKEVYGYTPEEMMSEYGRTLDHIHPEDRELLQQKIQRTLKEGKGGIEYRIIDRYGNVKYIYGHSMLKYKDGKPFVFNGVSVDVTEIRKAETALKEKIKEIEDVYNSITERFFSVDRNWTITYVNKQFEIFYQKDKDELIGKSIFEMFPRLKETLFYTYLNRSMEERIFTHSEGDSPTWGVYLSVDAYPTENGIAVYLKDITEQKKLDDQLLNEEQKLKAIINNTRDIIWYVDKDLNIISGNQAYYDRIAYMTDNKQYADVNNADFNNEEVIKWQGYFIRALNGERFKVIEQNNVFDKTVYEEINFNPIPDKDNNIVGISCFSRDITEEKLLQDKIFMERQNLKALINNTKDLIWSVDRDLRVISVNEPFVDFIYGFTGKILKPGDPIMFYDFGSQMRETWLDAYGKALSGKRIIFEDENIIEGKSFYTEKSLNPIFDDHGEVVGVGCFARDKSEEVKLRKQILKDEQSLRATIDNTRDHIWSVDSNLNIIFLNQSAKDFVFQVTGETLGAGDFILPEGFSQVFRDTRIAQYKQALTGEVFSIVDELYDNDQISYMETSFNPIKDLDGNVIGVNCYSRDITAQKKHLAKIEQQNAKLKEIAWIQSHKVRGPVASILGLIDLFNYEEPSDPVNKEILFGIKSASVNLDEIIKDVVIMTEGLGTKLD